MNPQIEKYIRQLFYDAQKGICPICLKPLDAKLSLDHDHATGEPRGLLHQRCNMMVAQKETHTKRLNYIISRQTEWRIFDYIRNHVELKVHQNGSREMD